MLVLEIAAGIVLAVVILSIDWVELFARLLGLFFWTAIALAITAGWFGIAYLLAYIHPIASLIWALGYFLALVFRKEIEILVRRLLKLNAVDTGLM